ANYYRHKIVVQNFQKELELRADQENFSSPLFHLELNELKNNFIKALEKLPGQQRTVFMMSRYDNLSHKEIANRLNISIKTVETHIGKALKSLRKALKSGS
ncbi:MAG TPA: sigma-70 family RNA polymerase sigma factor, partial [Bacteroidetes bacterium]|nr:sigma-70 family RNA polymerase sigma factor [Bacteroidota bacterium]